MFCKLALGNVRKSIRDYAVYFVTLALGVAVFYAFNTISSQADFLSADKRDVIKTISGIMTGTTVFLAFVLGFLMVYANNYLVRRRKRELGLYQVLGMTRAQVSRVLLLETLFASMLAFAVGLALGLLLSQLLVFVTAGLLQDRVQNFAFRFSLGALELTLACFALIFLVMLIFNLRTLRRVRLVDLMGAEKRNESMRLRSLPLAVVLFAAGVALIVLSYVRLNHDGLPLTGNSQDLTTFAITTALMIAGTFLFFYSAAGIFLRVAQGFHGAYYHGLNMFTVRQLAARVNTVSFSMSVIALVLFLAITSVTSGLSITSLVNKNTELGTPYDATVSVSYASRSAVTEDPDWTVATAPVDLFAQLKERGIDLAQAARSTFSATTYTASGVPDTSSATLADFVSASGDVAPKGYESVDSHTLNLFLMSVSDFNAVRAMRGLGPVSIGDDGYLLATDMPEFAGLYTHALENGKTVVVAGRTLRPVQASVFTGRDAKWRNTSFAPDDPGTIIVPDALLEGATPYQTSIGLDYSVDTETGDALVMSVSKVGDTMSHYAMQDGLKVGVISSKDTRTDLLASSLGATGVVSYLSIYIGFVLVISCAAILAIQQLSEASDSAPRFRLLSELGCPRRLSNRSLLVQTLVAFLAPLVVGLAHSICALQSVIPVVRLFGSLDIGETAGVTAAMFLVIYGAYFLVTYSVAKGVVNSRTVEARS